MVSFCDIPMSQIKEHIEKYGSYGIGLSQEWGRRKGLNPVLYVDSNSSVGNNYRLAFDELIKGKNVDTISDHDARVLDVLRYMKNYEADLIRGEEVKSAYRFADEKEWRYVPTREQCQILVNSRSYRIPLVKERLNSEAATIKLEFEPADIKYVIIKDDSEVSDFIQILKTAKGKKYYYDDVERLTTRLITVEQIKSDF